MTREHLPFVRKLPGEALAIDRDQVGVRSNVGGLVSRTIDRASSQRVQSPSCDPPPVAQAAWLPREAVASPSIPPHRPIPIALCQSCRPISRDRDPQAFNVAIASRCAPISRETTTCIRNPATERKLAGMTPSSDLQRPGCFRKASGQQMVAKIDCGIIRGNTLL